MQHQVSNNVTGLNRSVQDKADMQADLLSMYSWGCRWRLTFKDEKCVHTQFSTTAEVMDTSYTLNLNTITVQTSHRDLGVLFSSHSSWGEHYKMVIKRAYRALGLVRRHFSGASSNAAKKKIYLSLDLNLHIVKFYGGPILRKTEAFEQVQRRATKII